MTRRTKELSNRLDKLEKTVGRLYKQADRNGHTHVFERPRLGDLHGHLERLEKQVKALRKH